MPRSEMFRGAVGYRLAAAAGAGVLAAGLAAAVAAGPATLRTPIQRVAAASISGDGPSGFWYGTDSQTVNGIGSAPPYHEPVIGGSYGGYLGMAGNWAAKERCSGDHRVWSWTDSGAATTNYRTYHRGVGTGVYWFMGGPGVDPHYNGTASEASAWGATQARWALSAVSSFGSRITYPVIFADVELPGVAPGYSPATDNGWNSVYTSPCSGRVSRSYIPASVDRAEFNGFANYITGHSTYKAGVYSAPPIWASIFGTGPAASIPNTYEWTYLNATSSLSHHPYAWCLSGTSTCARFFGGVSRTSRYALMWQWSGGGGYYNGHGDFDQIDANRTP